MIRQADETGGWFLYTRSCRIYPCFSVTSHRPAGRPLVYRPKSAETGADRAPDGPSVHPSVLQRKKVSWIGDRPTQQSGEIKRARDPAGKLLGTSIYRPMAVFMTKAPSKGVSLSPSYNSVSFTTTADWLDAFRQWRILRTSALYSLACVAARPAGQSKRGLSISLRNEKRRKLAGFGSLSCPAGWLHGLSAAV